MSYSREEYRLIKLGLLPKTTGPKPKKPLRRVSPKKLAEQAEAKKAGTDGELDKFFEKMRKKMVGTCQCGCGQKSQKHDDTFYRHCICHIFPKRIFKSVATNEYNWVERTFWGGHHTNFDEQGMDKWPLMADWHDIKERFHILAPLLTDTERKTKFYSLFEALIYTN